MRRRSSCRRHTKLTVDLIFDFDLVLCAKYDVFLSC